MYSQILCHQRMENVSVTEGSLSLWEALKDIKESFPIQVTENFAIPKPLFNSLLLMVGTCRSWTLQLASQGNKNLIHKN